MSNPLDIPGAQPGQPDQSSRPDQSDQSDQPSRPDQPSGPDQPAGVAPTPLNAHPAAPTAPVPGPSAPPTYAPAPPALATSALLPPPAAHPAAHPASHPAVAPSVPVPAPPTPRAPRTPRSALVATAVITALVTSGATAGLTWAVVGHDDAPAAVQQQLPDTDKDDDATIRQASTDAPDWTAVAEAVRPSVVAIAVIGSSGSGEGSGVIIDTDGHVLTNNHVVSGAEEIKVTLADGRVYDATVVGTDPTTDLAAVAITDPPTDLTPAALGDSDAVAVGDAVMAVGNPLGLDSTVTTGIVSALDRPVSTGSATSTEAVVTNAIQVDAAINPGNSGGPLFNAAGEVIGVTSSIATLSQTGSTSGSIGLGFAIPVNLAQMVADALMADGSVEHAYLGLYLSDGTATVDGTTRLGAAVERISDGTPAAKADLQAGDVVVAVDGKPVGGALSLTGFVREHAVDDVITLTVVRDGKTQEVKVTLTARQETTQQDTQPEGRNRGR